MTLDCNVRRGRTGGLALFLLLDLEVPNWQRTVFAPATSVRSRCWSRPSRRRADRARDILAPCPSFASTASASRSTATAPGRARASRIRSASAARRCTTGSCRRAPSSAMRRQGRRRRRASTTTSPRAGFENLGAWILGRNMFGPVRGPWPDDELEGLVGRRPAVPRARLRADAPRARAGRRWRAAPRSTSSPTASRRRWSARARPRGERTSASAAACPTIRQYLQAAARRRDAPRDRAGPARGTARACWAGSTRRRSATACTQHGTSAGALHVVLTRA